MTITTTRTTEEYVGDGSQNAWPITFPFFEGSDIKACIVNSAGEQVDLTYGTDYTVTVSSGSSGGTLYYTLADGVVLTIWLSLPLTQGTDFYNTGPLNAEVLETSLDRLTLIAQQLQEESDRSIKVATSSSETPEELLADLYAGRDAAVASASAAATSESNAAASKSAAATSASDATASETAAASSAITAQAWAESETAPDPNDAESKSAKSWALAASDSVPTASTTYAGKVMASASLNVDQTTGEATVPVATTTLAGIVRQSTIDEAVVGEDDTTFMTPLEVKAVIDGCRARDDDMDEGTSTTKFPSVSQTLKSNLSNVSDTGKSTAVGWGMPDYSAGVSMSVPISAATAVSISVAGYLKVKREGTAADRFVFIQPPESATFVGLYSYVTSYEILYPVEAGSKYYCGTSANITITFYPLKGVVNV